jgi:hypothetical protein
VLAGSAQDTLPTKAADIGRRCLAQFSDIQRVAPIELDNMERLAIALGDSVTLTAAINRHLSLATNDSARASVLFNAFNALAYIKPQPLPYPRRFAWANATLARLDAMGASARVPRLLAHINMATLMTTARFDTTALLREDATIRRIRTLLTDQDRQTLDFAYPELTTLITDSLAVAVYRNDPDLKAHIRATVGRELQVLTHVDAQKKEFVILERERSAALIGVPAPPIVGNYWFPDAKSHGTPQSGKVTLVRWVVKGQGLLTSDLAALRRLYDKYHDDGLEIVLLLRTEGYSWASPPLSPADEAKTIAWYYRKHLGLPFTIVVDETPFTTKPDGRRVAGSVPFVKEYAGGATLVGRDGRIRVAGALFNTKEPVLDAFIEQALAARGKSVATSQ